MLSDPPPGQERSNIVTDFPRALGVVQGGMNETLARALVWNSLTNAGIHRDPDAWKAISAGTAGILLIAVSLGSFRLIKVRKRVDLYR